MTALNSECNHAVLNPTLNNFTGWNSISNLIPKPPYWDGPVSHGVQPPLLKWATVTQLWLEFLPGGHCMENPDRWNGVNSGIYFKITFGGQWMG